VHAQFISKERECQMKFVALSWQAWRRVREGKALRETEITFERSRKREQADAFPRILNNKSGSAT